MKLSSMKPVALAVAMALGAAVAQAQTLPSYSSTAPGTNGLYLTIWNASTDTTDLVNLSSTYSDVTFSSVSGTSVSGSNILTSSSSAASFTSTTLDGYDVQQLDLGTISNFSSLFGTGSGTAYQVTTQGDNLNSAIISMPTTMTYTPTAGAISSMTNSIGALATNWLDSGFGSPLSDTTGTPNYSVTGGNAPIFDGNDGIVGDSFGANVGTAAAFYQLATARGGAVADTQYTYNGQAGFWFLSSTGDLSWNLITGSASTVPLPPAVWLFASGLIGLALVGRRRQSGFGAAA